MKITKKILMEWVYITFGVMLVSASFSFFLDPSKLVIGGASGLAIIFEELYKWDTALVILLINIILLFVGLIFLGKDFFIKTIYGSLIFPIFVALFNFIVDLLDIGPLDMPLTVIFSAVIMGFGLGIVMKHGGTTGGTDIVQKILLKYCHIPFSVSLYLIDGFIVLGGYVVFKETQGISLVLYALIFIYINGITIDQVVFSGFNKRAVHIISKENDRIRQRILDDLNRGVTKIRIVGGYSKSDKELLICVLSSMEYYKLKSIIDEYDKEAFYYTVRANEVSGEGFSYASKDTSSQETKE